MRWGWCGGEQPVGEDKSGPFQLSFNSLLRVDFQGARVTSDGGLILVRELDERLGLGELIEQYLADSRGKNAQIPLADLLRQSVYSRLAGYEDLNDAERLSQDPAFRLIGSRKIWERGAALIVTIRCCCSIAKATASQPSCAPATFPAPKAGRNCCCRRSNANRSRARKQSSAPMRPSPSRSSAKHWKSAM